MVVVANSTPLISLSAIGLLSLLKTLYGDVFIPTAVYQEVVTDGAGRAGAREVAKAAWVQSVNITNPMAANSLCVIEGIDAGESEAIVLAQELAAGLILLDDNAARRVAAAKGLRVTGTVGILLLAKQKRFLPVLRPKLDELLAFGFHLSESFYQMTLHRAGEAIT